MATFRILSIDGGGSRGILSAAFLMALEQDTGPLADHFDLIAGTSTGSIIAAALAARIPAEEIPRLYHRMAPEIFARRRWFGARYSEKKLRHTIENVFGAVTMKDIAEKNGPILMITSFDLAARPTYRPRVFYSYYLQDQSEKIADLILRSTAAPTYFPIQDRYIDGGVAMNNPSMAAVAFAVNQQKDPTGIKGGRNCQSCGPAVKLKQIRLLSLGTGHSGRRIESIRKPNWGLWKWKDHLADLMIESNVQAATYYTEHMLGNNAIRIQPDLRQHGFADPVALDVSDRKELEKLAATGLLVYEQNKKRILKTVF